MRLLVFISIIYNYLRSNLRDAIPFLPAALLQTQFRKGLTKPSSNGKVGTRYKELRRES